ncbi:MAG: metallophosphoesterase [Bifidobacteriaceae bacterium]|jgi:predicted MPP superfamily phosphohydrolase|nr:metallophosphoesterase [Bifidobacteriaceae bacterium]
MKLRSLIGAGLAAGSAALGYALLEAHWYTLRRLTAAVLPVRARPIKLLHLSDLHLTARQRRKVEFIKRLADLEPDLVVTTGDNFAFADAMETALEALEPLLARPGAFVLGSNDYYSAVFKNPIAYLRGSSELQAGRRPDLPTRAFRDVLTRAGWKDLDNARASLQLGLGADALAVRLVGLADPHLRWDHLPPPAEGDRDRSRAGLVLGLVHAPYVRAVDRLVADGADLVLAGHTHGGQVALPLYGALVSNSDLPPRLAAGLSRWPGSDALIHVSAGLGTSPYAPIRLACRPEATLINLTPRPSQTGHPGQTR